MILCVVRVQLHCPPFFRFGLVVALHSMEGHAEVIMIQSFVRVQL